jgi:hypothetical protein
MKKTSATHVKIIMAGNPWHTVLCYRVFQAVDTEVVYSRHFNSA